MFEKIHSISSNYVSDIENLKLNIELIFNLIDSLDDLDTNKERYRKIVNKIFVIDIYSAWEQFSKKEVGNIYDEYKNILLSNNKITKNIFNSELKKVRGNVINDLGCLDLKSVFINTNNLKYSSLKNLLNNINADLNLFNTMLMDRDLQYIIAEIIDSGVSLYVDKTFDNGNRSLSSHNRALAHVVDAIFTIVDTRNEYSHTGVSGIYFNKEQMLKYCDFFKSLIYKVTDYLVEQISIKKGEHYSNIDSIKIEVLDTLCEYPPYRNKMSFSLKINSNNRINRDAGLEFLLKDCSSSNYFFVNDFLIEDVDGNNINNIIKGEQYIRFNTKCNLPKGNTMELYAYYHRPEHTVIKLI